jgi:ABC-type Zn2+ transport system substrate-binding protein/surface adhesin
MSKKTVTLQPEVANVMGKLAFILNFILAVFPSDATENRRHVHVIHKSKKRNKTHRGNTVAKFWIEKDSVKCIEVDWSNLTAQEEADIIKAIDKNWETINKQIDKVFAGDKVTILRLNR